MNTRDEGQEVYTPPDESGRCVCIIRNVIAVRHDHEVIGWGDVFLTRTDLYFVRYDIGYGEQPGADGHQYTLGGLLVGGPVGALIGATIDDARGSADKSKRIAQVKKNADRVRQEDFGLLPSQRLEKRGGLRIARSDTQRTERITNWWISFPVAGGRVALGYEHSALGVAEGERIVKSWVAGDPKASRETEGANVGVPIEGFLKGLCGDVGGVTVGSESDRHMASDQEYVAEFATRQG